MLGFPSGDRGGLGRQRRKLPRICGWRRRDGRASPCEEEALRQCSVGEPPYFGLSLEDVVVVSGLDSRGRFLWDRNFLLF